VRFKTDKHKHTRKARIHLEKLKRAGETIKKASFSIVVTHAGSWAIQVAVDKTEIPELIKARAVDANLLLTEEGADLVKRQLGDEEFKRSFVLDLLRTLPRKDFIGTIELCLALKQFKIDLPAYLRKLLKKDDTGFLFFMRDAEPGDSRMYG